GVLTDYGTWTDDENTENCIFAPSTVSGRRKASASSRSWNRGCVSIRRSECHQQRSTLPLLSGHFDSHGPKAAGLTEYGLELARETRSSRVPLRSPWLFGQV